MVETVISANNREEVIVLPFTPPGLQITEPQANDTFDGLSRGRRMIGTMQPRTVQWSSRFFRHRMPWMHPQTAADPMDYVDFFRKWRGALVPLRLVIADETREILNMAVTVDDFDWELLRTGDIEYSITLSEYEFIR